MTTSAPPTPPERNPAGRFFRPILAGATLRERIVACIGALLGICVTGLVSSLVVGGDASWPLIAGPIAASAVLIFAVPTSPLAQPWPIIGGNTISALVGVTVVHLVRDPVIATGAAVGLAILIMSLTRSLHPPGGATALFAVMGGPEVASAGYHLALVPIALNSVLLVALGLAFHKLTRRNYPHKPVAVQPSAHQTADPPAQRRVGFSQADIDSALVALDETFDIDRSDLDRIFREVEQKALVRAHGELLCEQIMSRDVISIGADETPDEARRLLLHHNIRTLPVIDGERRVIGTVGLRELAAEAPRVGDLVSPAAIAIPSDPALGLLPRLTDGRAHAVVIVDADGRVVGLITQTDLLAAVAEMIRR